MPCHLTTLHARDLRKQETKLRILVQFIEAKNDEEDDQEEGEEEDQDGISEPTISHISKGFAKQVCDIYKLLVASFLVAAKVKFIIT